MRAKHRRGGIYFAVLSVSILVGVIGLAALATARVQRLTATSAIDLMKAKLNAQAAAEFGTAWARAEEDWRIDRPDGAWTTDRVLGDGVIDIIGYDPLDGDISNRTTDPLTIRGVGRRGLARQMVEVDLNATGIPLDALRMGLHGGGQLRIRPGAKITLNGGPLSTNGRLRNEGTIAGDVECRGVDQFGTVSGSTNILAAIKSMPASTVQQMYSDLGSPMAAPNTIDRVAIGPGNNPWGQPNADGVYVLNLSSNLTIKDSRIVGTLVIISNGKSVTMSGMVNMQPYRTDYPILITDGPLEIKTTAGTMTEAGLAGNFNPNGVPYNPSGPAAQGTSNLTTSDSYPSGLFGLVHTRSSLVLDATAYIKGCVLSESSAGSNDIEIYGTPTIDWDEELWKTPPMGYTKSVLMSIVPGSWRQVVD